MRVLLGTTNPSKVKRFSDLLKGYDIEFITLRDIEVIEEPKEMGNTPEENAIMKAEFYGQYFDVVICNDSFHHYPSPEKVLDEAYRVLKNSGLIIIGDCWQPPLARQIMNIYMKYSKEGDVKIYSKKEMISLLSRRFHNVTWEHIGTTSCISYAIKQV